MRIAVAGAGGFIGRHVVERLVRAGRSVLAIDRAGAELPAGATPWVADLACADEARAALEGASHVVNATGLFDLGASAAVLAEVNVMLAADIVRAARRAGVRRVVHLSSVAVYGRPKRCPVSESAHCTPENAYERSKLGGERAVLAEHGRGIEVAVLRPTLVYGPRSRYGQAMMIALAAQARALGIERMPVLRRGPRGHHVHVEDVAQAVELALFHPEAAGCCFNVADDAPLPVGDALAAIAEAFGYRGLDGRMVPAAWRLAAPLLSRVPDKLLGRLNRRLSRGHRALHNHGLLKPRIDRDWFAYLAREHVFDTRRLKALGFRPEHPDMRSSIGDVIAWYARAGWIASAPQEAA